MHCLLGVGAKTKQNKTKPNGSSSKLLWSDQQEKKLRQGPREEPVEPGEPLGRKPSRETLRSGRGRGSHSGLHPHREHQLHVQGVKSPLEGIMIQDTELRKPLRSQLRRFPQTRIGSRLKSVMGGSTGGSDLGASQTQRLPPNPVQSYVPGTHM